MFDETTLFNLIKQEATDRTCIAQSDIHLESTLIDDLGLDDEDIEVIISGIQSIILAESDIICSNEIRGCITVSDLIYFLIDCE